jgi:phage repressor protein C with HTH and peptisase S24 domain
MGTRLKAALQLRERDAPWLIEKIGMSKGAVYNILDDTTKPEKVRGATIAKISEALGISAEWLQFNRGQMTANGQNRPISTRDATTSQAPTTRMVRIVGAAVVGENGFWKELQESAGDEMVEAFSQDPDAYVIKIANRRFDPAIPAGVGVLVEPNTPLKPGRRALVIMADGSHTIRNYHSHEHGLWTFTHLLNANDFLELPDAEVRSVYRVMNLVDLD